MIAVRAWIPEPVDWTETFEADDSQPYGSKILFETLDSVVPASGIERVDRSPYLKLMQDTTARGTAYLLITDRFDPDDAEANRLLSYARRGNTVWVSAHAYGGLFADTLNLEVGAPLEVPTLGVRADTAAYSALSFRDLPKDDQERPVRRATAERYFTSIDSSRTEVLAMKPSTDDPDAASEAVVVRTRVGKGAVVLSTSPRMFTNVALVDAMSASAAYVVLSYIPIDASTVYWDTRHKPLVSEAATPLRFVMSDPNLRRAVHIVLLGLVFLLTVSVRRRQRAVPTINPPENDTLSFVRTVGEMYHREGRNADLAQRKIRHFETYLRTHLGITLDDGSSVAESLGRRSGAPGEVIDAALQSVRDARDATDLDDRNLRTLVNTINRLYRQSNR
ncbi:DUF4350 domain-containing protein [Longibacter sp.]|uniref:DUF4350 domain-containing protein n=1 Tax=Longibacter sp. TaxID=2045415 RepID=UPI003EBDB329